jgi:hypothetical protein
MAEVTKEAKAFFTDIRSSIKVWSEHLSALSLGAEQSEFDATYADAIAAIGSLLIENKISKEKFEAYLAYAFSGLIHSVMVSIDGGSASADEGRQFWLVDENGKDICPALHEWFDPEGNDG